MKSSYTIMSEVEDVLGELLATLKSLSADHARLAAQVDAISGKVNVLSEVQLAKTAGPPVNALATSININSGSNGNALLPTPTLSAIPSANETPNGNAALATSPPIEPSPLSSPLLNGNNGSTPPAFGIRRGSGGSSNSKIILTSYPGQSGTDPIPFHWGLADPMLRGPVVVSRNPGTIRRRNAIGAHGGSYSIYHALAVASKNLNIDHKPDFTNTEPAATIGPFPDVWGDAKKIVSMDPFGHLAPWLYKGIIDSENIEVRPTIAITRAHMKLPELEESVRKGRLVPDGKICINSSGELAVTKVAVEPVWYLPGVAERFGIDEGTLRRALFEHTGGMYPELITRSDIKTFLPPIGGLTVYCFGDVSKMSDENVRLALRVHDECNGSDGEYP